MASSFYHGQHKRAEEVLANFPTTPRSLTQSPIRQSPLAATGGKANPLRRLQRFSEGINKWSGQFNERRRRRMQQAGR